MTTQPNAVPESLPLTGAAPLAAPARTREQKAQAKALKKERKHERLRFFFGWCEGCQAIGGAF
jgi:hypothetical protein